MKLLSLSLLGLAFSTSAETLSLKNWDDLKKDSNAGIYMDEEGSQMTFEAADGPSSENSAIKINVSLKKWGGLWASCWGDLSNFKTLQFKAKSTTPGLLSVQLHDAKKFRTTTTIKIDDAQWQSFSLPLSLFKKNLSYQDPSVAKDAVMDWASVQSISFDWSGPTESTFYFSSVVATDEIAPPQTGLVTSEGKLVVQDYSMYNGGTFQDDNGSTIAVDIAKDESSKNGFVANFSYDLTDEGWCGAWAECGHLGQGQDWQGSKTIELRVFSEEAIDIEMSFNDKNQNSYVAPTNTTGIGWETIYVNVGSFELNEYYQPENAVAGAALDLSLIKSFNLSPKTTGKHSFKVDLVALVK